MGSKIVKVVAFALVSSMLFSACSSKKESEYVTIGALYSLTGTDSILGIRASNAINMATQEINANGGVLGKKLDVIILDDEGDKTRIVEQYNELKKRGVKAIVGSTFSGVTIELAKASQEDNMPIITSTATNVAVTEGRPNVFRACFIDDYQAKVMVKFATQDLQAKTAVILKNTNDSVFMHMADTFQANFESEGGKIVAIEEYNGEITNVDSLVEKYSKDSPDVFYVPESFIVAKQFITKSYEGGIKDTKYLGIDWWDGEINGSEDKEMLKQVFYSLYFSPDDEDPDTQKFINNYFDYFRELPMSDSAMAYDAVTILVDAIERAGSDDTEAILKALRETDLDVISGHVKYDANNNPMAPNACIVTFENGVRKTVKKVSL